jgi:transcriptional regulator with XRE-family HTH domain
MRTKKRRQPRKPRPHSELGERIRAARLHFAGLRGEKLSQERLARELEVTPSAWSRLESGATKRPDRHAMYQLEELAGYEHGTILPELRRLNPTTVLAHARLTERAQAGGPRWEEALRILGVAGDGAENGGDGGERL